MQKYLSIELPDGSTVGIPVDVIARDRADYYKDDFGDDIELSLADDTLPLFEEDDYEIIDWACNNMDWSDVAHAAVQLTLPVAPDMQQAWRSATKSVVFAEPPAPPASQELPDVLFSGYDVYKAMPTHHRQRTSADNVSDTLDAVVKLLRAGSDPIASMMNLAVAIERERCAAVCEDLQSLGTTDSGDSAGPEYAEAIRDVDSDESPAGAVVYAIKELIYYADGLVRILRDAGYPGKAEALYLRYVTVAQSLGMLSKEDAAPVDEMATAIDAVNAIVGKYGIEWLSVPGLLQFSVCLKENGIIDGDDPVDRKFVFLATNPCNGNVYNQNNALVFCAHDAALPAAMRSYIEACQALGSNPEHIESMQLALARVQAYQVNVRRKVPDTNRDCEIARCIPGRG